MSSAVDSSIDLYVTDVKGNILKRERDCSKIANEALVVAKRHFIENNLKDALIVLLAAEKQARMAVDLKTTSRVMIYIIKACFDAKNYDELNTNVSLLVKRRAQLKDAVTDLVRECCHIAEHITDTREQIRFIETVIEETIGRVYVENERARLVRKLATIREEQGDVKAATQLMQELQVESYLTMHTSEKVDFMLEQLRLVFLQENYQLAEAISKKIIPSQFQNDFEMIQKYHILMARLQNHFKNYIEVSKHYKSLLKSGFIDPTTPLWEETARAVIVVLLMAERCDKQVKKINKLRKFKNIDIVGGYCDLLTLFLHNELIDIDWFIASYKERFIIDLEGIVCNFDMNTEEGRQNWQTFLDRVTEYQSEKYICSLVVRDSLYAKINSPEGYVSFIEDKSDSELLNQWATSFKNLVIDLKSLHDNINKEISIHSDENSKTKKTSELSSIALLTKRRLNKLKEGASDLES